MEKQLAKEIKMILVGRTSTDEDGWIVAAPGKLRCIVYGIVNLCFGLMAKSTTIHLSNDPNAALQKLATAFRNYGDMVLLRNDEDALACVRRRYFGKSILLTAKNADDGKVLLTAYAGRGCLASVACKRALKTVQKNLSSK